MRTSLLQPALLETVSKLDISQIDRELAAQVDAKDLAKLASFGLRGELLFATPAVLVAEPKLLGYYRLVLGYSQKDFYSKRKGFGAGPFKGMEAGGRIGPRVLDRIEELCEALCVVASELLAGLEGLDLSAAFLADLALLTLGPQFRGGVNNTLGSEGVKDVAAVIRKIVAEAEPAEGGNMMSLRNAAGRNVLIEFGADPDVTIRQSLPTGEFEGVLAIEIKAGTDGSSLYNRLGEAEKSHSKARANGYTECWTIVNVQQFDPEIAGQKSPSTNRFYRLAELIDGSSSTFADFQGRLINRIGLK